MKVIEKVYDSRRVGVPSFNPTAITTITVVQMEQRDHRRCAVCDVEIPSLCFSCVISRYFRDGCTVKHYTYCKDCCMQGLVLNSYSFNIDWTKYPCTGNCIAIHLTRPVSEHYNLDVNKVRVVFK